MGIVKINSVASLPVAYIIIIWYIKVLIIVWDIVIIADQVSIALRSVKTIENMTSSRKNPSRILLWKRNVLKTTF